MPSYVYKFTCEEVSLSLCVRQFDINERKKNHLIPFVSGKMGESICGPPYEILILFMTQCDWYKQFVEIQMHTYTYKFGLFVTFLKLKLV